MLHLIIIDRQLPQSRHHINPGHLPYLYQPPLVWVAATHLRTFASTIGPQGALRHSRRVTLLVGLGRHRHTGRRLLVTNRYAMFSPNTTWEHLDVFKTNPAMPHHPPLRSLRHPCSVLTTVGPSAAPDSLAKNLHYLQPAVPAWQAMFIHF